MCLSPIKGSISLFSLISIRRALRKRRSKVSCCNLQSMAVTWCSVFPFQQLYYVKICPFIFVFLMKKIFIAAAAPSWGVQQCVSAPRTATKASWPLCLLPPEASALNLLLINKLFFFQPVPFKFKIIWIKSDKAYTIQYLLLSGTYRDSSIISTMYIWWATSLNIKSVKATQIPKCRTHNNVNMYFINYIIIL